MGIEDLGQFTVVVLHTVTFINNHVLPADLRKYTEEKREVKTHSFDQTHSVLLAAVRHKPCIFKPSHFTTALSNFAGSSFEIVNPSDIHQW